jgi:hypothetical protein
VSNDILEEITRVLCDKFGWSEEALVLPRARIADFSEVVTPAQTLRAIKEDPSDNRILECGRRAEVSLSRHEQAVAFSV